MTDCPHGGFTTMCKYCDADTVERYRERETMSRLVKMLEQLQAAAVMSKFVTARECQAYRAAVEDMLSMLRAVPPEGGERHAVLEEAAKVCIAMYAKEPASRRTDILLEVASRIRELNMAATLDRTTNDRWSLLREGNALADEWWSMSWWEQTGRKGDEWERRMDELHARWVAAGNERMW